MNAVVQIRFAPPTSQGHSEQKDSYRLLFFGVVVFLARSYYFDEPQIIDLIWIISNEEGVFTGYSLAESTASRRKAWA